MNTTLSLVKDLLEWVNKFTDERGTSDFTIEDFLIWMNSRFFTHDSEGDQEINDKHINMELSFLLIMQNRHFKTYAKQALSESELSSPDSFSFLYHLSLVDSYRKMELVKMHQMEAPSGIEVLKRLLSKKYIEEYDDPTDKRAKRIKVTERGNKELDKCLPLMHEVFNQMTGGMNRSEKLHFIAALREINDFHVSHDKHQ